MTSNGQMVLETDTELCVLLEEFSEYSLTMIDTPPKLTEAFLRYSFAVERVFIYLPERFFNHDEYPRYSLLLDYYTQAKDEDIVFYQDNRDNDNIQSHAPDLTAGIQYIGCFIARDHINDFDPTVGILLQASDNYLLITLDSDVGEQIESVERSLTESDVSIPHPYSFYELSREMAEQSEFDSAILSEFNADFMDAIGATDPTLFKTVGVGRLVSAYAILIAGDFGLRTRAVRQAFIENQSISRMYYDQLKKPFEENELITKEPINREKNGRPQECMVSLLAERDVFPSDYHSEIENISLPNR